MAEEKESKVRVKRPTPKKRDLQNEKRRLINKAFKSKVRTAVRAFDDSLKSKDQEKVKLSLQAIYSCMDKGVKRGVFKLNTASRTKSRYTAKAMSLQG